MVAASEAASLPASVRFGPDAPGEILFDGQPLPTVFWNSTFLQFVTPAAPPGVHRIAVRDRVGSEAVAPDLVFE